MPITQAIYESVFSEKVRIDSEAGVIHDVRVLGQKSKNGRTYTQVAMEQAASKYEGIDVNLDHPDDARDERKMVEGFGVLRNVRVGTDGVYADLHYLKSHPLAATIVERAERFPTNFGLSHNAVGTVDRKKGGDVVESIERVESVDIVRKPATNAGLFESRKDKPVTTILATMRALAASADRDRLVKLLEEDAPLAAVPMDVPADASPEDAVKQGIAAMVLAIVNDDSLDSSGKLQKIKAVLGAADKMADDGAKPSESGGEAKGGDAATMESVQRLLRREDMREACEVNGMTLAQLTPDQRKKLEGASDLATMTTLCEAWSQLKVRPKPGVAPKTTPAATESYDELLKRCRKAKV